MEFIFRFVRDSNEASESLNAIGRHPFRQTLASQGCSSMGNPTGR